MVYVLPFDLYKDWKELMLAKEVSENIVKELKEKYIAKKSGLSQNVGQTKTLINQGK